MQTNKATPISFRIILPLINNEIAPLSVPLPACRKAGVRQQYKRIPKARIVPGAVRNSRRRGKSGQVTEAAGKLDFGNQAIPQWGDIPIQNNAASEPFLLNRQAQLESGNKLRPFDRIVNPIESGRPIRRTPRMHS